MREWRARGSHQQPQEREGGGCGSASGGDNKTRDFPRYHGRPPLSPSGSLQRKIPIWEKKFCTEVCLIPWKKLCETKRLMSMYMNVVEWDDSAGEEAFNNAKFRFWTEINGLPCDIPLPDPEMYIDVVDQETYVDPQLVEDLYKQPPVPENGKRDAHCGWDSFLFADKPVPATGWGDADDAVPHGLHNIVPTGWGDVEDTQTWNIISETYPSTSDNNAVISNCTMLDPVFCGLSDIIPTGWGDEDTPKQNMNAMPFSVSDNIAVFGVAHTSNLYVDAPETAITGKNVNEHLTDARNKKGIGKNYFPRKQWTDKRGKLRKYQDSPNDDRGGIYCWKRNADQFSPRYV